MGAGARTTTVAGLMRELDLRCFVGSIGVSRGCEEGCSGLDFRAKNGSQKLGQNRVSLIDKRT